MTSACFPSGPHCPEKPEHLRPEIATSAPTPDLQGSLSPHLPPPPPADQICRAASTPSPQIFRVASPTPRSTGQPLSPPPTPKTCRGVSVTHPHQAGRGGVGWGTGAYQSKASLFYGNLIFWTLEPGTFPQVSLQAGMCSRL